MLNEEFLAALPKGTSFSASTAQHELQVNRVELVVRCQELARFLRGFDENTWAEWVESMINQIRNATPDSVQELLDGYNGIANVSDVFLCPEAGHRVTAGDENGINDQYLLMLAKVNELARKVLALSTPIKRPREL